MAKTPRRAPITQKPASAPLPPRIPLAPGAPIKRAVAMKGRMSALTSPRLAGMKRIMRVR